MNPSLVSLDFDKILEKLADHARGHHAQNRARTLEPFLNEALCQRALLETSGAKQLIERCGTPPVSPMDGLADCLQLAQAGGMLEPLQFIQITRFLTACRRMTGYLRRGEGYEAHVSLYGRSFLLLEGLHETIVTAVDEERVLDEASPYLKRLRRERAKVEDRIRGKLQQVLASHRRLLSDEYISQRNGCYVLPVQKKHQTSFPGKVVDVSRTGGTVFMEPSAVALLQQEWNVLVVQEEEEVRRVLYMLSDEVAAKAQALQSNGKLMDDLDFFFAKGAFSLQMCASEPKVTCGDSLVLKNARHPLLDASICVPLNLCMQQGQRGIVLSGPNTGGKTLVLKTVGLLTMMAQCGLHVPCDPDSVIPMRSAVCCDIGDSQSISQNLSTFSGHMTNVIRMLESLTADTLVLLDELGSGTDPAEGAAIAIAVLEALRLSGCTFLITTHYGQVKAFAAKKTDIAAARMAFDSVTLHPLYRLEMGRSGESCAMEIIERLGMPQDIVLAAREVADTGVLTAEKIRKRQCRSNLVRNRPRERGHQHAFSMGDSVLVFPNRERGIVFQPENAEGKVIVQVKGVKQAVRSNRLELLVKAEALYPEDYDFSIVFDSVANRKAEHTLSRKHDPNAVIVHHKGHEN